jgi:WD40 repeat protein
LTSSSDGTTRLWDVGEGAQKRLFPSHKFSSVNVVSMGSREADGMSLDQDSFQERLFITGLSTGVIEGHDVASGSSVFTLPKIQFPSGPAPAATDWWEQTSSSSVTSLDCCKGRNLLIAGCSNGVTLLHDVRMLSSQTTQDGTSRHAPSLLATWRRNGAAINHIRLMPHAKEAILATADGTPYRVGLEAGPPRVLEEYSAWDVDNVQASSVDAKGRVWLAGADGFIRMY